MPRLKTESFDPNRGAPRSSEAVLIDPRTIYVYCTTVENKIAAMKKLGELCGVEPAASILDTLQKGGPMARWSVDACPCIFWSPEPCVNASSPGASRFTKLTCILVDKFLETTYATTKD